MPRPADEPSAEAPAAVRLRASEILASISDAFFAVDRDWRFVYVNEQAGPLLERDPEGLIGNGLWDEYPEAVGTPFWDAYHRAVETREAVQFDAFFEPLDRHFAVRAYPFDDGLSVYFADVTARQRAEDALREREERYRTLFESIDQGFCVIDLVYDGGGRPVDYRFVEANPAFEAQAGFRTGGRTMREIAPGIERHWFDTYDAVVTTGRPVRFEDHSEALGRWFDVFATRMGGPGSRRLAVLFTDVTEQKGAEAAVRASEARARLALDAARLGLWSLDPATGAGTQDARTQEILGLAPDEQVTMAETFGRLVHPDDVPATRAALEAALDPDGDGRLDVEVRLAGEPPRWVRATARTTFGPDRQPAEVVGTLADVTAQKETERGLVALIDGLPELAWSARPDGHIDFYNERWYSYTGTTFEDMEGWAWQTVHDPAVLPEVVERWQRAIETGEPFEMEFPLRRADGVFRWFLTRATPFRDADGRVARWIGVNTDVHDRRRAETRATFLADAGRLVEEALDFDAALDRIAALAVPAFADWCSISLRRDDGSIGAVAIAHADPEKVRWGWELEDRRTLDPDDPTGVPNVVRTGQSELYAEISDELLAASASDPEELALLREVGFSSAVIVPMRAGDEVVGAVSFVSAESGRRFDAHDLATAEEVGRRAGAALETARLYRALQERERELQTLANSIPQLAWMADASGTVGWFNRRWYEYTGTEPGTSDMGAVLHPDEAARVAERYRAAFAAGEPWEDTFRIRGADGDYRWFLSRALPFQADGARAARWFGTNTDVTEQRSLLAERDAALDRLRQSEERHRLALEGGGMGTWEWHVPEDRLESDDRAHTLWGMRPGEVESVAAFYARLVHPDDLEALQAEVARVLADEEDYAAEFRIVRPDGRVRWVANRGRLVRDADGEPVRMFGLSYDVTERREAEETLRQKNAEMEQFAYTISHDLKSPLVTITGFLGLLKGQVAAGQTERALASADRVLGAADRMGRLIEDLLHLSRAGRVTGDPAPVSLDALVGGLADGLRQRAEAAGGTISVEAPLGRLLADERRLGEVVENLLANAVTYGLGGGGTRVAVRSEWGRGGGLRLVVEDDGPGVPEAYRQKVFELFQRLDGGGEGTGIGLALVARIMEVTGGTAWVESAGGPPGRPGARFVLEFPASAVLDRPPA